MMCIAMMAVLAIGFVACSDDEDPETTPAPAKVLSKYFTIAGAETINGSIPQSAQSVSVGEVSMNNAAIAGGSSHVSINTDNTIQKLYANVKGSNQYYSFTPSADKSTIVDFTILFSQNLNETFTLQISALLDDGTVTALWTTTINYIAAGTGALQISLSFDNDKDVDLYVVQPDGEVIYYGNHGMLDYVNGNYVYIYGLDLDSNPGCSIDGINNENVFYPTEYIQEGTYEVWVNMYSNCDASIPTNWIITAIHEGNLITPTYGTNPAAGVYPIGEPSNPIGSSLNGALKVMEFSVTGSTPNVSKSAVKAPLTESAKMKLTNAVIK